MATLGLCPRHPTWRQPQPPSHVLFSLHPRHCHKTLTLSLPPLPLPRRRRTPLCFNPTLVWMTTLRPKRWWSWHHHQAQDSTSLRPRSHSTNDTSDSDNVAVDAHAAPRAGDGADFTTDNIALTLLSP